MKVSERLVARLAAAAVMVVLAVLGSAGSASAHATLLETTPNNDQLVEGSPPAQVSLRFDEAVEASADSLRVFGPSGGRADEGELASEDGGRRISVPISDEGPGTYTVAWRVLSEDSHNLSGSFVFHVDTRTGAADISTEASDVTGGAASVARWLALAGTLAILGGLALALTTQEERPARRLRLLVAGAGGVATVASALWLVSQTAISTGRNLVSVFPLVVEVGLDARAGVLIALRTGCLLLVTVIAAVPFLWRRAAGLAVTPALGAVVLTSITGHPWTSGLPAVAVTSDAVHLTATGLWIGGLVALLLVLPVAADRPRRGPNRPATLFSFRGSANRAALLVIALRLAPSGDKQTHCGLALGGLRPPGRSGHGPALGSIGGASQRNCGPLSFVIDIGCTTLCGNTPSWPNPLPLNPPYAAISPISLIRRAWSTRARFPALNPTLSRPLTPSTG